MKVLFELTGSERNICLKLRAETDFEQAFIDRMNDNCTHIQESCSAISLLLETGYKLSNGKEEK
jgi:hypothetical protein